MFTVNPLLLIAVCLQFCVDHCRMSENEAGMLGVSTNVGAQCVKMSPIEHLTCTIEYYYYTIKINVAYQNNSLVTIPMVNK